MRMKMQAWSREPALAPIMGALIIVMLCSRPLSAAGLRDLEDGWLVRARCLIRLLEPLHSGRPADHLRSAAWISLGQGRLYGLTELPLNRLAVGFASGDWDLSAAWQRLGGSLFREDRLRLRLCMGRRAQWFLQGGFDCWSAQESDGGRQPALAAGLAIPLPWQEMSLTIICHLLSPPAWQAERSQRRCLQVGGRYGFGCWAVALDRSGRGEPAVQLDLLWRLGRGVAWGLRCEPATGSLGPTLTWYHGTWLLRSSHVVHPELGLSHRWSLSFGRLGGIW